MGRKPSAKKTSRRVKTKAESKKTETKQFPIHQIEYLPEASPVLFIDGAWGISSETETLRFSVYQNILIPQLSKETTDPHVSRRLCGTLVMTHTTAVQFADWLSKAVDDFNLRDRLPDPLKAEAKTK